MIIRVISRKWSPNNIHDDLSRLQESKISNPVIRITTSTRIHSVDTFQEYVAFLHANDAALIYLIAICTSNCSKIAILLMIFVNTNDICQTVVPSTCFSIMLRRTV